VVVISFRPRRAEGRLIPIHEKGNGPLGRILPSTRSSGRIGREIRQAVGRGFSFNVGWPLCSHRGNWAETGPRFSACIIGFSIHRCTTWAIPSPAPKAKAPGIIGGMWLIGATSPKLCESPQARTDEQDTSYSLAEISESPDLNCSKNIQFMNSRRRVPYGNASKSALPVIAPTTVN
jgi:hypothetical protein